MDMIMVYLSCANKKAHSVGVGWLFENLFFPVRPTPLYCIEAKKPQ